MWTLWTLQTDWGKCNPENLFLSLVLSLSCSLGSCALLFTLVLLCVVLLRYHHHYDQHCYCIGFIITFCSRESKLSGVRREREHIKTRLLYFGTTTKPSSISNIIMINWCSIQFCYHHTFCFLLTRSFTLSLSFCVTNYYTLLFRRSTMLSFWLSLRLSWDVLLSPFLTHSSILTVQSSCRKAIAK